MPPLHHNCRSSFIALSEKQAGKVTAKPPSTPADDGFGRAPTPDAPAWKPDLTKYPAELAQAFVEKDTAR